MSGKPPAYDYKWIQIYRNGDVHSSPVRFFISKKYHKTFECLLTSLTHRLNPTFGAIRRLYTLQGSKVTHFEELLANQKYVAAGYEKFRRISYENWRGMSWRRRHRPISFFEIQPVTHSRIKAPSRYRLALENSVALTIFVYRNGDDITPAHVVPLSKKDMLTWDLILKRISERVLPTGFVRKLYTLNGKLLGNFTELENGESYVAVAGYEGFRNVTYGLFSPPVTRRFSPWRLGSSGTSHGSTVQGEKVYDMHPTTSSSSCGEVSNDSGRNQLHLLNEREKQKGIFTVKDGRAIHPGKIREVDYDTDNGGVYRAKSEAKEAVHEINDSEETSTELPLDARIAEEVKDEEIDIKPLRPRKELNSSDFLDTMPAAEPALEVDFSGNQPHSPNDSETETYGKEESGVDTFPKFKKDHQVFSVNLTGGQVLEENEFTGKPKKLLPQGQLRKPQILKARSDFTLDKEPPVDKANLPQHQGDYVSNSDLSSDREKQSKTNYRLKEVTNLLLSGIKQKAAFGYSMRDAADASCSSPSETSGNSERRSRVDNFTNHPRKLMRKKRSHASGGAREKETSTVTYSPKSTTSVTEDEDSNLLTSQLSIMSISDDRTAAETDISYITSREDFAGYISSGLMAAHKTSSDNAEFGKQHAVPYRFDVGNYISDHQTVEFAFPRVSEEFDTTTHVRTSGSSLSLTINSRSGSPNMYSETTSQSENRSSTSHSENFTDNTYYLNKDESASTLHEKENLTTAQYNNNYKINSKIRSNALSIPHMM